MTHPLLLAFIVVLMSGSIYRYRRRRNLRRKRHHILKRTVQDCLNFLTCLEQAQQVGAGKKGIVYAVRLKEGWERQLGILWKTSMPLPERVALKIYPMDSSKEPDSESVRCLPAQNEKTQVLIHLAPRIEEAGNGPEKLALCPLFAVGEFLNPKTNQWILVEIMPLLEGESLGEHLARKPLLGRHELRQLVRVLKTSYFFDRENCFERSIDDENVMVLSDGTWIRIDIDSTRLNQPPPRYRMMRIARLTNQVLKALNGTIDPAKVRATIKRIKPTATCFLRKYEGKPLPAQYQGVIIETPRELIEIVENLTA